MLTLRNGLKIAKTMLKIIGWLIIWNPFTLQGKAFCKNSTATAAKLGVKYATCDIENPSISIITLTPETFYMEFLKKKLWIM